MRIDGVVKSLSFVLLTGIFSWAAPPVPPAASGAAVASTAPAQASAPRSGTVESSKLKLDAQDAAGALADAETAVANGGGADAYAARADAERALGHPIDEVIADYAEAARLDPRYLKKYRGLLVQAESERNPKSFSSRRGIGLRSLPRVASNVLLVAAVSGVILICVFAFLRGRGNSSPREKIQDDRRPSERDIH